MKRTGIIAAAILTVMAATPVVACTDWEAVAAFDAIIAAHAQRDIEEMNKDFEKVLNAGNKLSAEQVYTSTQMYGQRNKHDMEVETDRAAALADQCQDNAR